MCFGVVLFFFVVLCQLTEVIQRYTYFNCKYGKVTLALLYIYYPEQLTFFLILYS